MQIQQKGVGFDANFKPESSKFTIGNPARLIIMVRDKLYSDKLRVFIQEYISNARDANREVDKPDHLMDITAPTRTEPIFKVRDYGPGLSPDRVENVFLKFGESTKNETDKYIGGFGIGAKSGWAYTDSFVVRSFHEGIEYHYLCHLGEDPAGTMAKLFEGPTTEPNGVEIQVQVQQDDIQRAHGLIRFLTKLWPVAPNIVNMSAVKCKSISEKELPFEIGTDDSGSLPELTVALDGIPYAIQCQYLTALTAPISQGRPVIFRAATGEIDVAATRENVEINAKFKAWLNNKVEQTIYGIQKKHLERTGEGFVRYVDFWLNQGRKLTLQRGRPARTENTIDYDALRTLEEKVMEGSYFHTVKHHPETIEYLKELNLIVLDPTDKKALPSFPRIEGFCWYFKKEKTLLVNGRIFPVSLKDAEVFGRRREKTVNYGDRRSRKELFQMPYNLWKGYVIEDNKVHHGIELKSFDRNENMESSCSSILYNDEPKEAEKLKRLTNRINNKYTHILDVQDVPQFLKDLRVSPLSKHITPVWRSEYTRVNRPSGSVRFITWGENYDAEFNFGSYQEPTGLVEAKKSYFQSGMALYTHTTEPRSSWGAVLKPHMGRMSINQMTFIQGNKKGMKFLQEKFPKVRFVHWKTWADSEQISESNITQIEYEQFAFEWLRATCSKVTELWTEGNKIQLKHLTDPLYSELVQEVRKAEEKRGGRYGSMVGDYFVRHRDKLKNLDKSRIYQLRMQILKKYPLIPLIEVEASHRNVYPLQDLFNEYMDDPKNYMRNRVKQHGNAEDWLQSKK